MGKCCNILIHAFVFDREPIKILQLIDSIPIMRLFDLIHH